MHGIKKSQPHDGRKDDGLTVDVVFEAYHKRVKIEIVGHLITSDKDGVHSVSGKYYLYQSGFRIAGFMSEQDIKNYVKKILINCDRIKMVDGLKPYKEWCK